MPQESSKDTAPFFKQFAEALLLSLFFEQGSQGVASIKPQLWQQLFGQPGDRLRKSKGRVLSGDIPGSSGFDDEGGGDFARNYLGGVRPFRRFMEDYDPFAWASQFGGRGGEPTQDERDAIQNSLFGLTAGFPRGGPLDAMRRFQDLQDNFISPDYSRAGGGADRYFGRDNSGGMNEDLFNRFRNNAAGGLREAGGPGGGGNADIASLLSGLLGGGAGGGGGNQIWGGDVGGGGGRGTSGIDRSQMAPYPTPSANFRAPGQQPGRTWVPGQGWVEVQNGADLVWDSTTDQDYFRGTPISKGELATLWQGGPEALFGASSTMNRTFNSAYGALGNRLPMPQAPGMPQMPTAPNLPSWASFLNTVGGLGSFQPQQPNIAPPGIGPGPNIAPPGIGPGPDIAPPGIGPAPRIAPPRLPGFDVNEFGDPGAMYRGYVGQQPGLEDALQRSLDPRISLPGQNIFQQVNAAPQNALMSGYVNQATQGMQKAFEQNLANQISANQSKFAGEGAFGGTADAAFRGQLTANLTAEHLRDLGTMQLQAAEAERGRIYGGATTQYGTEFGRNLAQEQQRAEQSRSLSGQLAGLAGQGFGSRIGAGANAYGSQLGALSSLYGTEQGAAASMYGSQLGAESARYNTQFGNLTEQYNAQLGARANQYNTQFGNLASIYGNQLGAESARYNTQFGNQASMFNALLSSEASKYGSRLNSAANAYGTQGQFLSNLFGTQQQGAGQQMDFLSRIFGTQMGGFGQQQATVAAVSTRAMELLQQGAAQSFDMAWKMAIQEQDTQQSALDRLLQMFDRPGTNALELLRPFLGVDNVSKSSRGDSALDWVKALLPKKKQP